MDDLRVSGERIAIDIAYRRLHRPEPDYSRPVRSYGLSESYSPGDRIEHPTLGTGVVQGEVGPGKIQVLFGEKKSLLVHERVPAGS